MINLLSLLFTFLSFSIWEKDSAEIVFAGDAMQHSAQIDAAKQKDGTYNYDACFSNVSSYFLNADYAVVNLETPLGGKPYTGYPCFSAPDSYLTALSQAGFDLMLAANNHTLDRRDKGVLRTIEQFETHEIGYIGIYRNQQHRQQHLPFIHDINGFKVAFLNYTYGTNGITIQGDIAIDYIDRKLIQSDIEKARVAGAEIITTCIHWGNEYQLLPNKAQQSLADYLCELGVDLIIGGHPHVIQPMEMRYNAKYNKNTLLVYSLGNFISNMKTRDTRGGATVKVLLKRNSIGKAYVDNAKYRLFFTIPPTNKENFKLIPAEKLTKGNWSNNCQAFKKSAEAIFNKHNIGVPCDTTEILPTKETNLILQH